MPVGELHIIIERNEFSPSIGKYFSTSSLLAHYELCTQLFVRFMFIKCFNHYK